MALCFFIIFNFTYIQAFLHCLITGNKTNRFDCMVIGVSGSLLGILEWTKFHHLYPQAIMAPGMCEDPVTFEPLSQIVLGRSTYNITSYVDFAPYV